MPNFESMYYRLMNRVSIVIDELKETQREAENAFIDDTAEIIDFEDAE